VRFFRNGIYKDVRIGPSLLTSVSVKHVYYRFIHLYVTAHYLDLVKNGEISSTTWVSNTFERLEIVLDHRPHILGAQELRMGVMNTVLRLREELAGQSDQIKNVQTNAHKFSQKELNALGRFAVKLLQAKNSEILQAKDYNIPTVRKTIKPKVRPQPEPVVWGPFKDFRIGMWFFSDYLEGVCSRTEFIVGGALSKARLRQIISRHSNRHPNRSTFLSRMPLLF
jgi:hypothetical protein